MQGGILRYTLQKLSYDGKIIKKGQERIMKRPHVICHMTTSIDGKVTGDFLFSPECKPCNAAYYQINRDFHADAYACGRVTMSESFTGGFYPELSAYDGIQIPREDYIADKRARFFAVAFDRYGRLGWTESQIIDDDDGYGGAHIIEVLCEKVDDRYLAYLQKVGVSYIFAGEDDISVELALEKLCELFCIRTLLLEGGSIINGAFAKAGLIDELSLVQAPIAASTDDKSLFYECDTTSFTLTSAECVAPSVLWLRYKKN